MVVRRPAAVPCGAVGGGGMGGLVRLEIHGVRVLVECAAILATLDAPVAFAEHSVSCASITAPPGAIYLAGDSLYSTFNGNNFAINGNDVNYTDGLNGPMPAVWGIAADTAQGADELRNSLNS